MTEYAPELVERMAALVRAYGNGTGLQFERTTGRSVFCEAMELASLLPEPVDPDLIEARAIAAEGAQDAAPATLAGEWDNSLYVRNALAGIKRGRELAQGDA